MLVIERLQRRSFGVTAIAVWFASVSAVAQPAPPMPDPPAADRAGLVAVHKTAMEDPSLEYDISLPKEWSDGGGTRIAADAVEAPMPLGAWSGATPNGPNAVVCWQRLARVRPAAEVVAAAVRNLGWKIVQQRDAQSGERPALDLVARGGEGSDERICRLLGFLDAERLFLIAAAAPASEYAARAETLAAVVHSFRLAHGVEVRALEWKPAHVAQPFQIAFSGPADWVLQTGEKLRDGQGVVYLRPPEGSPLSVWVRIHAAPADEAREGTRYEEMAIQVARAVGFVADRVVESAPVVVEGRPEGSFLLVRGQDGSGPADLRIYTILFPAGRVTLSAYSPAFRASPDSWRAAGAVLDRLVHSLEVKK